MAAGLAEQADRKLHAGRREITGLGGKADADRGVARVAHGGHAGGEGARAVGDRVEQRQRRWRHEDAHEVGARAARWTCMSMNPGSSVRSSSSSTSASAGIVSDERAPAAVIRPFSMTTAARSTGRAPAVDESLGDDDECWQLTYLRDRELDRPRLAERQAGSAASRSKSSRVSMSIGWPPGRSAATAATSSGCARTSARQPDVSLERVDVAPELASEHHRRMQQPVEAERRRGQPGGRLSLEEAVDELRADVRLIAEDDDSPRYVRRVEAGDPGPQRRAHPLGMPGIEDDARTPEPDRLAGSRRRALRGRRRPRRVGSRMPRQGPLRGAACRAGGSKLLRLAHPSRRPRREDDPRRARGGHFSRRCARRNRAGSATNCSRHAEQQKKYVCPSCDRRVRGIAGVDGHAAHRVDCERGERSGGGEPGSRSCARVAAPPPRRARGARSPPAHPARRSPAGRAPVASCASDTPRARSVSTTAAERRTLATSAMSAAVSAQMPPPGRRRRSGPWSRPRPSSPSRERAS